MKKKTITNPLAEIAIALLLVAFLAVVSYYKFSDKESVEQRQQNEMIDYQRSQGRNAVIEDELVIIKTNEVITE